MNILALNWNDLKNPNSGGAEVHLEELLKRLVVRGHQVTLFCSGFQGCKQEEIINGIRVIRRGSRHIFNLVAPFHLRKLVRKNSFDLLVEDINKIPFYTPLYLSLKTLVVVPHLFATTVFQEINALVGSYIFLAERPLVYVYRGLQYNVISQSTADDLIQRGVSAKDISIIHCGIDHEHYNFDQDVVKAERPTILYLGRLKKYKSIHHLIIAFARVIKKLPNAQLQIVGAGDHRGKLESLSSSLELGNSIEFTGFVSEDDKLMYLRKAHVAVLPSLKEGWGLTNIEANAVGTPVVAADVPGLRDSVRDGESGHLYEYGNIDQLTDFLMRILENPEHRRKLETGARKWAATFSWDSASEEFERLLKKVVDSPS